MNFKEFCELSKILLKVLILTQIYCLTLIERNWPLLVVGPFLKNFYNFNSLTDFIYLENSAFFIGRISMTLFIGVIADKYTSELVLIMFCYAFSQIHQLHVLLDEWSNLKLGFFVFLVLRYFSGAFAVLSGVIRSVKIKIIPKEKRGTINAIDTWFGSLFQEASTMFGPFYMEILGLSQRNAHLVQFMLIIWFIILVAIASDYSYKSNVEYQVEKSSELKSISKSNKIETDEDIQELNQANVDNNDSMDRTSNNQENPTTQNTNCFRSFINTIVEVIKEYKELLTNPSLKWLFIAYIGYFIVNSSISKCLISTHYQLERSKGGPEMSGLELGKIYLSSPFGTIFTVAMLYPILRKRVFDDNDPKFMIVTAGLWSVTIVSLALPAIFESQLLKKNIWVFMMLYCINNTLDCYMYIGFINCIAFFVKPQDNINFFSAGSIMYMILALPIQFLIMFLLGWSQVGAKAIWPMNILFPYFFVALLPLGIMFCIIKGGYKRKLE